jgi:hypothetical protein
MRTYPRDRQEFLNWCDAHADVWTANAATIGISAAGHRVQERGGREAR